MARKKQKRELPTKDEMTAIMSDLGSQGDEMLALMGAAYLDNMLEEVLRAKFRDLPSDERKLLFNPSHGVLGTFRAKISLAHALGLVDEATFGGLKTIQGIRNAFAHPLRPVDFDTPSIEEECLKLAQAPFWVMAHMLRRPGGLGALPGESLPEFTFTARDAYAGACVAIYAMLLGTQVIELAAKAQAEGINFPYDFGEPDAEARPPK